jgi:hypothetical protein
VDTPIHLQRAAWSIFSSVELLQSICIHYTQQHQSFSKCVLIPSKLAMVVFFWLMFKQSSGPQIVELFRDTSSTWMDVLRHNARASSTNSGLPRSLFTRSRLCKLEYTMLAGVALPRWLKKRDERCSANLVRMERRAKPAKRASRARHRGQISIP